METLTREWPLLAGFLTIIGAVIGYAVKLVIGLYERLWETAESARKEAVAEAKSGAEQMERLVSQQEMLTRQQADLARVIQELVSELRRGERR